MDDDDDAICANTCCIRIAPGHHEMRRRCRARRTASTKSRKRGRTYDAYVTGDRRRRLVQREPRSDGARQLRLLVRPVPVQMRVGRAESRCRCGWGEPSLDADVGGVSPVLTQMRAGRAESRCRCGRGEPSPDADVGGVSPASPGADVGGASVRRRCGGGATPRRGRALPRLQAFQRETWR
jgi:hypothetical protein